MRLKDIIFLCITCFCDYLGLAMVLALFPTLILSNGFDLPHIQYIILGTLLAAFPLAQFFSAPWWAGFSDKYGRRSVLIITLSISTIGYLLTAYAIYRHNLILLYLGRFLCGTGAGNVSVAQSSIIDVSTEANKSRLLARVAFSVGSGFVVGPFVGGNLADFFHSFALPFSMVAILFLALLMYALTTFSETTTKDPSKNLSLINNVQKLSTVFQVKNVANLVMVWTLTVFAISLFQFNIATYMVKGLNLSPHVIGNNLLFLGLGFIIASGWLVPSLSKKIKNINSLLIPSILGISLFTLSTLIIGNTYTIAIFIFLWGVSNGVFYASFFPSLSNAIAGQPQAEVIGSMWSINSLTQIIVPLISGFILSIYIALPLIIAVIITLIGIFFICKQKTP